MDGGTIDRISAQRALEALRNGVPNGDAVRALGCMQPAALDAFHAVAGCRDPRRSGDFMGRGMIGVS